MSGLSVGPPTTSAATFIFGLKLYELLTLVGIVTGPIAAVAITLLNEMWRQRRDAQMRLLQTLITTRVTPANDQWSMAVNMVPIIFRHRPKVIEKWKDFVNHLPVEGSQDEKVANGRRGQIKQIAMIHAITTAMGLKITEGDLQATGFYSKGSTDRDTLLEGALMSLPSIATNTGRSADAAHEVIKRIDASSANPDKNRP